MGKKRKFIDKKNSITFALVSRSQHDPLIADPDASRHVLAPIPEDGVVSSKKNKKTRMEKQHKHGIFYDDVDYDYMQHLKTSEREDIVWEPVVKPGQVMRPTEAQVRLLE